MESKAVPQGASNGAVRLDLPNSRVFLVGVGKVWDRWVPYWFELVAGVVSGTGVGRPDADRSAARNGMIADVLDRATNSYDDSPWDAEAYADGID